MEFQDVISKRRAYRSFEGTPITLELIKSLSETAGLAPSCFNYQPWNFVFVYEKAALEKMKDVFSHGNVWAHSASMIAAVFAEKAKDCVNPDGREYYLFDSGMAAGFLILKAADLGLIAHPIAGYDEAKTKEILNIPAEARVISLILIGKKSKEISPLLNEKQVLSEKERPERKKLDKFVYLNNYDFPFKL